MEAFRGDVPTAPRVYRGVLDASTLWTQWNEFVNSPDQKQRKYTSIHVGAETTTEGHSDTLRSAWSTPGVYVQYSVRPRDGDPPPHMNPLFRFATFKDDKSLHNWLETALNAAEGRLRASPAFINGDGVFTTKAHIDDYNNLLLVLHGTKEFYLASPNSEEVRHRKAGQLHEAPESCPSVRRFDFMVSLNAGDALYVPRNWWHHVVTKGRGAMVNFWFD
tara:strand:+ start:1126 stop:1782 length:657 start_codon:yes stop_codon:yes gene_type:complete